MAMVTLRRKRVAARFKQTQTILMNLLSIKKKKTKKNQDKNQMARNTLEITGNIYNIHSLSTPADFG